MPFLNANQARLVADESHRERRAERAQARLQAKREREAIAAARREVEQILGHALLRATDSRDFLRLGVPPSAAAAHQLSERGFSLVTVAESAGTLTDDHPLLIRRDYEKCQATIREVLFSCLTMGEAMTQERETLMRKTVARILVYLEGISDDEGFWKLLNDRLRGLVDRMEFSLELPASRLILPGSSVAKDTLSAIRGKRLKGRSFQEIERSLRNMLKISKKIREMFDEKPEDVWLWFSEPIFEDQDLLLIWRHACGRVRPAESPDCYTASFFAWLCSESGMEFLQEINSTILGAAAEGKTSIRVKLHSIAKELNAELPSEPILVDFFRKLTYSVVNQNSRLQISW